MNKSKYFDLFIVIDRKWDIKLPGKYVQKCFSTICS